MAREETAKGGTYCLPIDRERETKYKRKEKHTEESALNQERSVANTREVRERLDGDIGCMRQRQSLR